MADKIKLMNILDFYLREYVSIAHEQVVSNCHMNELSTDSVVSEDDAKKTLTWFFDQYKSRADVDGIVSKIDLLSSLTDFAKESREEFDQVDASIRDALIVDFINYVGVKQWVDYALYTSDILKSALSK